MARYIRQTAIEGWNQDRLSRSHVTVCGVGGLGSAALFYLAAAGIGELTLIDSDRVEPSNLNRQILYTVNDLDSMKVESAHSRIHALNPDIKLNMFSDRIETENLSMIGQPDVIVDALDNMKSRFLLNRYAWNRNIPLVSAAVEEFEGTLTTVFPGRTACLECIYGYPSPPTCPPVLGTTAGLLGTMQANETIKILLNLSGVLEGEMLMVDTRLWTIDRLRVSSRNNCAVCSR